MDGDTLIKTKPLIVLCGLGGVGKTSLAAACGYKAAHLGKKTLVLTVDPAKRLAQALGLQPAGLKKSSTSVQKICDLPSGGSLSALMLDPKSIFDEVIARYAPNATARDAILSNPLYQHLSGILAGSQEYMAMEKLYALVERKEFDTIIVDTPPARHAIDFLEAPLKLTHALNDSVLQYILNPSLKLGKLGAKILTAFSGLTGKGILQDIAGLFGNSLQLMEGFVSRAQIVQELLRKKNTAFLLVVSARFLSFQDSLEFVRELKDLGFHFEGTLINRAPVVVPYDPRMEESKNILLQAAMQWMEKRKSKRQVLEKILAPLIAQSPYHAWIPALAENVNKLDNLLQVAKYF